MLALQREKVVSVKQRNCLEEEWNFVRSTCPNIRGGESLAAIRFWYAVKFLVLPFFTLTSCHVLPKRERGMQCFGAFIYFFILL